MPETTSPSGYGFDPFGGGFGYGVEPQYDQNYGWGGYNYNLNWFDDSPWSPGYMTLASQPPPAPGDLQSIDSLIAQGIGVANDPFYGLPRTTDASGNPAVWTQDSSGNTVLMNVPDAISNPIPDLKIEDPVSKTGGFLGGFQFPDLVYVPGIGLTEAAIASVLLSGGIPNLLSGGSSQQGIINRIGDIIEDPIGTTQQTVTNIGQQTGLVEDPNATGTNNSGLGGVLAGANSGNSSSGTGGANPGSTDVQNQGGATEVLGGGGSTSGGTTNSGSTSSTEQPNSNTAVVGGPSQNNDTGYEQRVDNNAVLTTIFNQNKNVQQSTKVKPGFEEKEPTGVLPGPSGTWTPATSTTTSSTTPSIIVTPTPSTNMPTTPVIGNGTQRDFYQEGLLGVNALNSLTPNLTNVYGNASRAYGQADYRNFGDVLAQYGISNAMLGGIANNQTVTSNTALRTGNVQDAAALGGQALQTLKSLNPNQYAALDMAQRRVGGTGPSATQMMLEQQTGQNLALGGQLSAQDRNQAQQAAREAWGARGLINSKGAIGAEILNTDALSRQRLAERQAQAAAVDATGYSQRQGAYNNVLQNAAVQAGAAFNPFSTITSANTQNQGTNASLFGQVAGISSGQYGNQLAQQQYFPWTTYAGDVYGTNVNAQLARDISNANNAAAIQGANTQGNASMLSSIVNGLFGLYKNQPATVASVSGKS